MGIQEYLQEATGKGASDLFIVAGLPLTYKINRKMIRVGDRLMPEDTRKLIEDIYVIAQERKIETLEKNGDDDFSFSIPNLGRFRVSTYRQRGSLAAVIRLIAFRLPNPEELSIPSQIMQLAEYRKGLVLVTGSAGSGKSTTLACLIEQINSTREEHIITLEDPLEFLHRHKKSIVSQREVSSDTESYKVALRASLRQSPDVILLGEMRDYETINIAMTAAETGHLVFSTLHTLGAANAVDRIIDVFPANQQRQIIVQLASVLNAVVSQQLLPDKEGKLIPAFELMTVNRAIKNMIRDNKVHQIDGLIGSSGQEKMFSMDSYITKLYKEGKITRETALDYATAPELMAQKLLERVLKIIPATCTPQFTVSSLFGRVYLPAANWNLLHTHLFSQKFRRHKGDLLLRFPQSLFSIFCLYNNRSNYLSIASDCLADLFMFFHAMNYWNKAISFG